MSIFFFAMSCKSFRSVPPSIPLTPQLFTITEKTINAMKTETIVRPVGEVTKASCRRVAESDGITASL